ncbi:unnamed protein product [Brassica napus]|uniref:(rape) hypothetical protein n=1 Tax=Brassica napus TaxID=3708 RepID=A0A816XC82_BRANA|nr:unnamed protein product [Brassica napus]
MPKTNPEILSSCDDGGPATPNPVQAETTPITAREAHNLTIKADHTCFETHVSWSSAGGLNAPISGHATQRLSADNKSVKRSIPEHCEGDEDLEKSVDTSKTGESECERGSSIMTWREHGGTVLQEP